MSTTERTNLRIKELIEGAVAEERHAKEVWRDLYRRALRDLVKDSIPPKNASSGSSPSETVKASSSPSITWTLTPTPEQAKCLCTWFDFWTKEQEKNPTHKPFTIRVAVDGDLV